MRALEKDLQETIESCVKRNSTADQTRRYNLKQLFEKQHEVNHIDIGKFYLTSTEDIFNTQIIVSIADVIQNGGLKYQWEDDPTRNDERIDYEITKVFQWYISKLIMFFGLKNLDQFDNIYFGVDENNNMVDISIFGNADNVHHHAYTQLVEWLIGDVSYSFRGMAILDILASSVAFTSEKFSGYLAAQWELVTATQRSDVEDGTYVLINDNKEDWEKIATEVTSFLNDDSMTLETLRDNVFDAFYELA